MKKIIVAQFIVLLIGTVFAWSVFTTELVSWLNNKDCTIGCSADAVNPFLTPCFGGATFFLISLILSVVLVKRSRDR